jgi:SAM-dependent methyltransferase
MRGAVDSRTMTTPEYALGSDEAEIARLQVQAAAIAEPTELLLQRGGIEKGMRVLDLGTGPGDVAFQLAEMVGPDGSVVGVDRDGAQLAEAARRQTARDLHNVTFRQGDARTYVHDGLFDAVVCRLLLFHLPDAVDVVAHHARALPSGGLFVAVDYDLGGCRALPPVELVSQVCQWLVAGFQYGQADPFIGMRLPLLLEQAGLRDVNSLGVQVYFPPDRPGVASLHTGAVRSLVAAIVASGAATEDELGLDTLEQRLGDAVRAEGAVWTMPTLVGGWGRRA